MVGDNRFSRPPCTHHNFDDIYVLTVRIQKAQLIFLACVRDRKLHVFNLHSLLLSKLKNPKLILNDLIVDYETN